MRSKTRVLLPARHASTKASGLVRTLRILVAVLSICGLQLYAQRLDPRVPPGVAARTAAARGLAGRASSGPTAAAAIALPEAAGTFVTFDARR